MDEIRDIFGNIATNLKDVYKRISQLEAAASADITGGSTDPDAIHDNVDNEINLIAAKAVPVNADIFVIEDSDVGYAKKKATLASLSIGGVDPDAIHDNVAGEINAIAVKAVPVDADVLVIEDSADAFAKKKVVLTDFIFTEAEHTAIGDGAPHHAAVTLGVGSDAALALAGQELTLADVLTPAEGDARYTQTIVEGPDIDLTGPALAPTIGRGGDTLLLFDSGGAVLREYAFSDAGLTAGLAAMAAGDVLELCAGTISGGPWTVAHGTLKGVSQFESAIDGQLSLSDGTYWENMSLIRSVNNADMVYGLVLPAAPGVSYVKNCIISVTQAGAGQGVGIHAFGRGDLGTGERDPGWIHSQVYGSTNDII